MKNVRPTIAARAVTATVILICAVAAPAQGQQGSLRADSAAARITYADGARDGEAAAREQSVESYKGGGFLGGFFGGPVGAGIAYAITAGHNHTPPPTTQVGLQEEEAEYRSGYLTAYEETLKGRRLSQSLKGGIFGTGMLAVAIFLYIDLAGGG